MEDPEHEISGVIHALTQSPPLEQQRTIEKYFMPDATFQHPFCRTGSWQGSRFLIRAIYRWYKIMSPRIDLEIHSVAYDKPNLILYVQLSQVFRIWVVPFYRAPVRLVTVLRLERHKGIASDAVNAVAAPTKYYIAEQNDLYQVNEFVKFVWPGGHVLVWIWQLWSTLFCLLGALVFWPISVWEQLTDDDKQMNG
ncbi:hypothetical protein BDY21DRAFT_198397 [Lineolata rhizophorae]|uniref:SigF-like NTF2-like domain-containing protein n=1 Tax=Lineolata rhizophorae TaxID=578093 RepID=A0A6A6P4Q6_9PEZI|nr:hypothetical protein BDY21DRAFT_198397 [Lineolata rhizophorae]